MSDPGFAFPKVPVELRPLFIAVANVLREELRDPGHRATMQEAMLLNRIRHAFEGYEPPPADLTATPTD